MQVFLLATDETPRLRPLTEHLPTSLVPVVDRPVLARVLELLARSGLKQARMALYRLPGNIERYCGDGRRWGVHLDYQLQREVLGSAGSLKWAEGSLKETFLVLPADVLIEADFAAALAFHKAHGGPATAILAPACDGAPTAWVAQDGRVCGLGPAAPGSDGAATRASLTGAYIFEPRVLELVPARTRFDCAHDLLPCLLDGSGLDQPAQLRGYVTDAYWNPLDTFAALHAAQETYLRSAWTTRPDDPAAGPPAGGPRVRYPSLAGLQIAPGIWAGRNLAIHPSVRLAPPVYLGDNCQVGQEVELGPMAILGPNVIVDDQATVQDSLVLDDTYVGRLVNVVGRVVDRTLTIDAATGASTVVVDRFLLGETTPASMSASFGRFIDGAGAVLLLLLASPVILLSALAASISSLLGGRGLCMFERLPRAGRPAGAPAGPPAGAPAAAPREFGMVHLPTRRTNGAGFTPLGRFLESSELDRLPALWNVLVGDLRLVGVQPLTVEEMANCTEDWQRERLAYPPGLTGLWYVEAPRGAEPDSTAVADAYYVATRTRGGDLRILWQTPGAWLRRMRGQ